ncbi:MAG: hypothetical protein ABI576_00165 [Flavobacterium sp.]
MIQKIILASLLFTIGCKSQEKREDVMAQQNDNLEHFDKKKFDENKKFGEYIFKLNGETKIRQMGPHEDKTYSEDIRKNNSPFRYLNAYFLNAQLKSQTKTFYVFPIGITKEYDENGKLIKETNHDVPYKFSIDDLREKIKREYQVDIVSDYRDSDPTLIFVNRWEGYNSDGGIYKKGVPMYQIRFPILNRGTINLEINALNGETIMEMLNGKQIKP